MLPPPTSSFYPLPLSPSLEVLIYSRVRMSSICRITDPELAGGRKVENNICARLSVAQTLAIHSLTSSSQPSCMMKGRVVQLFAYWGNWHKELEIKGSEGVEALNKTCPAQWQPYRSLSKSWTHAFSWIFFCSECHPQAESCSQHQLRLFISLSP